MHWILEDITMTESQSTEDSVFSIRNEASFNNRICNIVANYSQRIEYRLLSFTTRDEETTMSP